MTILKKIKKLFRSLKTTKTLIIVLAVIAGLGIMGSVYFSLRATTIKKEFSEIGPQEKLAKLHAYAVTLERFKEFQKKEGQGKTTINLEEAVVATKSGVLKTLFDELVFGENLEADMAYFEQAVVDSLEFFSRQ